MIRRPLSYLSQLASLSSSTSTVTENLELIFNSTTSFIAKFVPSDTGLQTTCWASLGVEVHSTLEVTDTDPQSKKSSSGPDEKQNQVKNESRNGNGSPQTFVIETSTVSAPFYVFWIVKRQFVATHSVFGERVTEKLRREETETSN